MAPPHVLRLRLIGTESNRDAAGALVKVSGGGWQQTQTVRSGSSYVPQSELVVTFGLGRREAIDALTIEWPSGNRTDLGAEALRGLADHEVTIVEGRGVVEALPTSRSPR